MAKQSGLGWTTFSVDNATGTPVVIKNDISDCDISTPRAVQDVTGLDKSAIERILLLADMSIGINGVFNPSGAHTVFSSVPSTSVPRTVSLGVGGASLAGEVLFTNYQLKRAAGGALTYSAPGVLADGNVPTWS